MAVNLTTIALLALLVAVLALLFGPAIGIRFVAFVRKRLQSNAAHKREITEFLRHSALFLEGLPHFITHTWSWGPSVPNYEAAGSFPPETYHVMERMPAVCNTVRAIVAFYIRHSKTQGLPCSTLAEALKELKVLELEFWNNTEIFAKHNWPLRWSTKIRKLRALQIPASAYDRIRGLKVR